MNTFYGIIGTSAFFCCAIAGYPVFSQVAMEKVCGTPVPVELKLERANKSDVQQVRYVF